MEYHHHHHHHQASQQHWQERWTGGSTDSTWPGKALSLLTRPKIPFLLWETADSWQHQQRESCHETSPTWEVVSFPALQGDREGKEGHSPASAGKCVCSHWPKNSASHSHQRAGRPYPGELLQPLRQNQQGPEGSPVAPDKPSQPKEHHKVSENVTVIGGTAYKIRTESVG